MTVLFVTNHVPPDRAGAFRALHARVPIELALFGGRSHHATRDVEDPGVPFRRVEQREIRALAASGRYAAVVCGTAGRRALPAAWVGARSARTPFVLWTALWQHPRTAAFAVAGTPLLRALYVRADAVVTYGPHVTAFVRERGARRVFEAPQAVDRAFWEAAPTTPPARPAPYTVVHVGRPAAYKGVEVLLKAWRAAGWEESRAALVLVGGEHEVQRDGAVLRTGHLVPEEVRNFLAVADVAVMPAIRTPEFLEPWGLAANEAMHAGTPVIATDAVGAAAGGLVRHERNGLVVPAGDASALTAALRRLRDDAGLRERLGAAAHRDAAAFTHEAWAAGFVAALESASNRRDR